MVGEFGEVQIMDWGLAKVVGDRGLGTGDEGEEEEGQTGANVQHPTSNAQRSTAEQKSETEIRKADTVPAGGPQSAIRNRESVRSVRSDSDVALTVDGQITGTPAYMPPEQAEGRLELIDHRSDVYSLGAILYEILTLERPIEGDTVHKVLLNVSDGKITPPEQRTPERHVPKELSAVVMKAMTKNRRKRYQSVPELSQDIKRFLEGRSVSAREDSFAESVVKLVKRNKAVSLAVGVAAAFLVTTTSFFVVGLKQERDRAVASENRALVAEEQQRETALAASKRFASQAIRAAEAGRWDEAERRAADAETVALKTPWGAYAKGSFARMKHDYEPAAGLFRKALAIDPNHQESQAALSEALASMGQIADVEKLLANINEINDWRTLLKAGRTLYAANRWRECQRPLELGLQLMGKDQDAPEGLRNKTAEEIGEMVDRAKAEVACEGFYEQIKGLPPAEQIQRVEAKLSEINGVTVKIAGRVIRNGVWVEAALMYGGVQLRYLHPFRGLSLQKLGIVGCDIRSLAPLKGMPLTSLKCSGRLSDLSPVLGMPLTYLDCHHTGVSDLSPLRGMRLTHLECYTTKVCDLTPLKGMPLEYLNCLASGVTDLRPLAGMPLTYLSASGCTELNDLSPLRGTPLTYLNCHGTKVSDLSPLEGLPLKTLILSIAREVSDLSPLAGMPLRHLNCYVTGVTDLSPLKGMPLEELDCSSTGVEDLSPLKGLPLKRLNIANTKVSDLGPLKGLPLTQLACLGTRVRDLGPLKGMALTLLRCDDRKYTDLTPLAGMPLRSLLCLKKDQLTPESVKVVEELIRRGCQVTW